MKVSTEKLPDSQVKLEVEVEPERVERSIDSAYRRLAQRVRIPGFRPGKAPRAVVERHLGGREALLHEALDRLVPEVYDEALQAEDIHAIDLPQLSITNLEPVKFTATVPVRPSVDLKDYKSVRLAHESVEVPDEQVDATLERLQRMQATLEPVERKAQLGDVIRADVKASIDGAEQFSQEDAEFPIREGVEVSLPGFTKELIGITSGDERTFSLPVPDDYPDEKLRGKKLDYTVKVNGVKEERLPELDDDFARGVRDGFDSLDELKERIRSDIRDELERHERDRYESKVLDQLLEIAEIEFPPVLVEREVDHLLRDHSGNGTLEEELQKVGKTEDEVKAELRPQAEDRVRRSLILGEVADVEGVEVGEEDVNAEIERLVSGAGDGEAQLRKLFESDNGRATIRRSLTTRRTFERLVTIAEGDGSGGSARAASPGDKGKSSRSPKELRNKAGKGKPAGRSRKKAEAREDKEQA